MEIRGHDLVTGLPRTIEVTAKEIEEALKETINQINMVIIQTLELTLPVLTTDIIDRGLLLNGGVALIPRRSLYENIYSKDELGSLGNCITRTVCPNTSTRYNYWGKPFFHYGPLHKSWGYRYWIGHPLSAK